MLLQHNITRDRRRPAATSGAKSPLFLPRNSGQLHHSTPRQGWPTAAFDTRRNGIRFQVEAAPLGRGAARDAAGRAGSLRGPRRVFLCAEVAKFLRDKRPHNRPNRQFLFIRYLCLTGFFRPFRLKSRAREPFSRQSFCSPTGTPFRFFSERPHECQIGSGPRDRCAQDIQEPLISPPTSLPASALDSVHLHCTVMSSLSPSGTKKLRQHFNLPVPGA